MTKLTIHADCSNAPKKRIPATLTSASPKPMSRPSSPTSPTTSTGRSSAKPTSAAKKPSAPSWKPAIITHGPEAAVNGIITTEQGGSFAFCDIYQFASPSGTNINAMTSYVISLIYGD